MREVTIHEAKTHLSRLLQEVENGETIVVKRGRTPIAKIVSLEKVSEKRVWPDFRGQMHVPDDFNAPMDDDFLNYFQL